MNTNNSALGIGLLTAIASSLCCIAPLLAVLAGTAGLASNFQWIEPIQPYLIGLSVLALGFAWYQQLKPVAMDNCGCEVPKSSFFQGKGFLSIITVFAVLMLAFPLYAKALFPAQEVSAVAIVDQDQVQTIEFAVSGMTCDGCEGHVEHAVKGLSGIVAVKASYKNENTIVKFDTSQTTLNQITAAIKTTNYQVKNHTLIP